MAEKRPLVYDNGQVKELPLTDTLPGVGGGGSGARGVATITIPFLSERKRVGSYTHTQIVSAVGVSPSSFPTLTLKASEPTDHNDIELLDIKAFGCKPLTDQLEIKIEFNQPATGPINFYWSV